MVYFKYLFKSCYSNLNCYFLKKRNLHYSLSIEILKKYWFLQATVLTNMGVVTLKQS